ncbi:MAG: hypothetical protein M3046_12910 [Actinomycetota bacterium]|nr:hypothetical protein [Actinomycetota bacterium]
MRLAVGVDGSAHHRAVIAVQLTIDDGHRLERLGDVETPPLVRIVCASEEPVGIHSVAPVRDDHAQPARIQIAGRLDQDRLALGGHFAVHVTGGADLARVRVAHLAGTERRRRLGQLPEPSRHAHALASGA